MAVTYGYFNSVNGDRKYDADQMSKYFDGLISNGVYENVGGAMQVIEGSGMTVYVKSGRAVIDCKWCANDANLPLTVSAAHATLSRYTAIIVRLDVTNRKMEITTKNGTAAASPSQVVMTNTDTVKEICLAQILVTPNASSISQSNITDKRASSQCGWITGLIQQVDTSELFLQWQTAYEQYYIDMTAAFDAWLQTLAGELQVNTFVQNYKKVYSFATSGSKTISLDMSGYTFEDSDIITVHINGLLAVEGTDYTLNTSGTTPTVTPTATASGTKVIIDVIKSKIGFYTLGDSNLRHLAASNGRILRI